MALGFELFQGYYFARPVMIEGRKLQPSELAVMELLAEASFPRRLDAGEQAFMVGIMSLMDTLLGTPLAQVLDGLAAPPEVRDALLGRSGTFGPLLALVESLECGSGDGIATAIAACPALTAETVNAAHSAALFWTSNGSPAHEDRAEPAPTEQRPPAAVRSRAPRNKSPESAPERTNVRNLSAR